MPAGTMSSPRPNETCGNEQTSQTTIFDAGGRDLFFCADSERFLNSDPPPGFSLSGFENGCTSRSVSLSRDTSLPAWDYCPVFNNSESFSGLLQSDEWDMTFATSSSAVASADQQQKTFFSAASARGGSEANNKTKSTPTSRNALNFGNHDNRVGSPHSGSMFGGREELSWASALPMDDPRTSPAGGYDWNADFFSQLQLFPPPNPEVDNDESDHEKNADETEIHESRSCDNSADDAAAANDEDAHRANSAETELMAEEDAAAPDDHIPQEKETTILSGSVASAKPKRKRKRKPRKKVVPAKYNYKEPADIDVLLGRGGRSNHHPGNKRYRAEVENLRRWYKDIADKDEKTNLSQCLVDYVHSYGGKFLSKDEKGWYEAPNLIARRKASQALREDNDPKKRAAKRARYLKRKADEATE